eukprot:SAG31_NODE_1708_length_7482_cov_15.400108_3_plen_255_part_00
MFALAGSPAEADKFKELFSRTNRDKLDELLANHHTVAGQRVIVKVTKNGHLRQSSRLCAMEERDATTDTNMGSELENHLMAKKRALAYHLRARFWTVTGAPECGDIIWKNLSVRPEERRARTCGVNLLVLMVLFFFTTPITMLAGLLTLSQPSHAEDAEHASHTEDARAFLYNVATVGDGWPWLLRKWVREYIPTWSLLCTTLTVLTVMEFFTKFERHSLQVNLDADAYGNILLLLLLLALNQLRVFFRARSRR